MEVTLLLRTALLAEPMRFLSPGLFFRNVMRLLLHLTRCSAISVVCCEADSVDGLCFCNAIIVVI